MVSHSSIGICAVDTYKQGLFLFTSTKGIDMNDELVFALELIRLIVELLKGINQ